MSLDALIDRYCEAWSQEAPDARRQALADCWAEGAIYCDPTASVSGAAALADHIDKVRAQLPGMTISRTSRVDAHHDCARFGWTLESKGAPAIEGIDFVTLANGRITGVTGFFGALAPAQG